MNSLLQKVISQTAKSLFIDEEIVQNWINYQKDVPDDIKFSILYLAQKYRLDPIADEISFVKHSDGKYQAFITIDGWSKLMESHPQFAGLSLREANEFKDDMPMWMECSIYRNDRIFPIVIKEYLAELRTDHPSWQSMPRRMLRHRVIQQCARLAFGISVLEMPKSINESGNTTIKEEKFTGVESLSFSRARLLKEKLSY